MPTNKILVTKEQLEKVKNLANELGTLLETLKGDLSTKVETKEVVIGEDKIVLGNDGHISTSTLKSSGAITTEGGFYIDPETDDGPTTEITRESFQILSDKGKVVTISFKRGKLLCDYEYEPILFRPDGAEEDVVVGYADGGSPDASYCQYNGAFLPNVEGKELILKKKSEGGEWEVVDGTGIVTQDTDFRYKVLISALEADEAYRLEYVLQ